MAIALMAAINSGSVWHRDMIAGFGNWPRPARAVDCAAMRIYHCDGPSWLAAAHAWRPALMTSAIDPRGAEAAADMK